VAEASHAVFISYASQDAEAAQKICGALRAAGIEVFLDQSELRGGDAWDKKIRREIHDCVLFVPIVSRHTQERLEGYFRHEWKLAIERTHHMAEQKAFLVPVVVDGTGDREAFVPEAFREVQWTRLPAGETPPEFVARIQKLLSGESGPVPMLPRRLATVASRRSSPLKLAVLAVVVLAAVAAYLLIEKPWSAKPEAFAPPAHSIAVLPFVNMSPDKENEYFSDGVTDELITALSEISGLRVAARTSSFAFKGRSEDVRTIGAKLDVGAVLEGSVSKEGNRIRLTAQLINTANGYHLWSHTYDRELKDIFAIRTELAETIGAALRVSLLADERRTLQRKPTEDIEAYQLYLHGRHAIATLSAQGLSTGLHDLQEAIARDPGYALAYLGLAYYYVALLDWIPGKDALARARAAAEKALELDSSLAEAHAYLGWILWLEDFDHTAARREFTAALEMQPRLAPAHAYYGWYLVSVGETQPGLAEARRAVELDPLSAEANTVLGFDLFFARRYDEAVRQLRTAVAVDPDYFWSHEYLGRALAQQKQWAESLAELRAARALPGSFAPEIDSAIARVCADKGDRAEALRILAQMQQSRRQSFFPAYAVAVVNVGLGDTDAALKLMDEAYAERGLWVSWIGVDPDLDRLRSDPGFQTLMRKVGLLH
jgi:TolB-like protein/Tfp pilus assembly protein PilF